MRLIAQSELGVSAPDETAVTSVEMRSLKPTCLPASRGFCHRRRLGPRVNALDGAPASVGALSGTVPVMTRNIAKRFARSRRRRSRVRPTSLRARGARASRRPTPLIASGSWHGVIARAREALTASVTTQVSRPVAQCTAAELDATQKTA